MRNIIHNLSFRPHVQLLFVALLAYVQPPVVLGATNTCLPADEGPQIGLALSGGGARGIAHVGVLEVLEELHVPVHCITGTSMGAVVGALYASGYSVAELKRTIEQMDWGRGFADEFPRAELPLRRKVEEDAFTIPFELGVNNGAVSLPRGVIQGHSLHLLLKELLGGASLLRNFNQLPIPYRAVATDIVTSDVIAISEGDLARAVQASMTIPGVFEPVEIDGRLLVDGGVTRNLPVVELQEMGADIIIAVDVGTPLTRRKDLASVVKVVDQLTNVLIQENVKLQKSRLNDDDVFIQPDLDGYTTMGFGQPASVVAVGRDAARIQAEALSQYSLSAARYVSYRDNLGSIPALPDAITTMSLDQQSRLSSDVLQQRLLTLNVSESEPFDPVELHGQLDRLYSTGLYQQVSYDYVSEEEGQGTAIDVKAADKTWGPDLFRFGFTLEDDFSGNNQFSISAGYIRKAINSRGGDIRAIGKIGEDPELLLEFFQPFEALSDYYALASARHVQHSLGLPQDTYTAEYRLRRTEAGFYLGRQFEHYGDLRVGAEFAFGNIREPAVQDDQQGNDFDEVVLSGRFMYDTLDSIEFPSAGLRFGIGVESQLTKLGADDEFDTVSIHAMRALTSDDTRFIFSASINTVTRGDLPPRRQFLRGGFLDTSSLQRDISAGQHTGSLMLAAYRPFVPDQIAALEFPVYYGIAAGVSGVFQHKDDIDGNGAVFSGTAFLAADTPAGPAYLGIGMVEEQGIGAQFALGVTF